MTNSPNSGKIYIYSIYIVNYDIYFFVLYICLYIYISLDCITELMAFG